jgi:protocatechuate 3,4-dioxygenase, alpha subunit
MSATATPGQTVGPFFGYALEYDGGPDLVPGGHPDAIRLHGRVLDGAGDPVPDALVELWQADPEGRVAQSAGSLRRDGSTFTGWGRAATDADGAWSFTTLVPGPSAPGRASYVGLTVFARGLTNRLFTRAYLPTDENALAGDPLLAALGGRRGTLIAEADESGFAFDIRLQGDRETVFLAYPRH